MHLIEGAIPTEGAIAHVLVSKFADHLLLYRQSQILARSGIELHRSTLADWVGKASFHLRPVFDSLTRVLKTSDTLGPTVRVLDPGRGTPPATRQAVRWIGSVPLVNAFGVWLHEQRERVSPRSRLGEKLTYIANQREGLLVFLHDGRVEIDSNGVEMP